MNDGTNNTRSGRDYLQDHIDTEIASADAKYTAGEFASAFVHLERAHVLGQAQTFTHTRVHWRMLKIGWKTRDVGEMFGQVIRIVGAATKTAFGIYPKGNTGGANVYFFKPMQIPDDLQAILDNARTH